MNVLTVVQDFLIGGLETRIQGEIKWANEYGHGTYFVTSDRFIAESLPTTTLGIATGLDISDSTSPSGLLHSVDCLINIVQRNDIDVIHVQPFAALLPAMLTSQLTKTPLVVSLHGPASLSRLQRGRQWAIQSAFGLTYASLVGCVSPEVATLTREFVGHDRVEVFPNCVDVSRLYQSRPLKAGSHGRWAFVGRLDQDKKEGVIAFLNAAKYLPIETLDVIGDGECRRELEEYVRTSSHCFPSVKFLGAKQRAMFEMEPYAAIAGMGRVVVEACAMLIPVILVGYDGVKGWVDTDLFLKAAYSNFSGRGLDNSTERSLREGFGNIKAPELESLRKLLLANYDEEKLWKGFHSRISSLSHIECDVIDELIGIFRRFSGSNVPYCEHPGVGEGLDSMIFEIERKLLLSTRQLDCIRDSGSRFMLQMVRAWRIGERDRAELRHAYELSLREKEIARVKSSLSWRLTTPVRLLESVTRKIQKAVFDSP